MCQIAKVDEGAEKILKTHTASVEAKIQKPLLRISKEFIKVELFFFGFCFLRQKLSSG